MRTTDVIIIGGGQAGLAMSRCLVDRGIDHEILERGRTAESWRSQRWDSLRLLTPNWQSRLPGQSYDGDDPHGFMRATEFAARLERYRHSFSAPLHEHCPVHELRRSPYGYRVQSERGEWRTRTVVVATGACGTPLVPTPAAGLSGRILQLSAQQYRNPEHLPKGGVLVVGASSSGVQIAEEVHNSGRPVTLAVGKHTRLLRQYRGRDIMWWLDALGYLSESAELVTNLEASRRQPSLQLIGRPDGEGLHLGKLEGMGVRLVGRVEACDGETVQFSPDLHETVARAEGKLESLLHRIDADIERRAWTPHVGPAVRPHPIRVTSSPSVLNLRHEAIETVIWATGYQPRYPWLRVPVLDVRGEIEHRGGITRSEGLYVLGLRFLRRRNSNFIDGVGDDARVLAAHIAKNLHCTTSSAAA